VLRPECNISQLHAAARGWGYAAGSWDEVPVDWKRTACDKRTTINNTNNEWCELSPSINESDLADFKIAAAAIARLEAHSERQKQSKLAGTPPQPLFLAVGFRDNHLPWSSTAEWRARCTTFRK
jgi:hypothetical protein